MADGVPAAGTDEFFQGSIGTHGLHLLFLAESDADGWRSWLESIAKVAELEPRIVVAGHAQPGNFAGNDFAIARYKGTDVCSMVVGPFAAIIWNGASQELVAVRDPFGERVLYHHASAGRLVVDMIADPERQVDALRLETHDLLAEDLVRVGVVGPRRIEELVGRLFGEVIESRCEEAGDPDEQVDGPEREAERDQSERGEEGRDLLLAGGLQHVGTVDPEIRPLWRTKAAGFALLGLGLVWTAQAAGQADFDDSIYPVAAMRWVEEQGLLGQRLMTDDAWGGYLILKYWPKQKVFVDDRYDMYPRRVLEDFIDFSDADGRWREILDRNGIEVVVWPAEALWDAPAL